MVIRHPFRYSYQFAHITIFHNIIFFPKSQDNVVFLAISSKENGKKENKISEIFSKKENSAQKRRLYIQVLFQCHLFLIFYCIFTVFVIKSKHKGFSGIRIIYQITKNFASVFNPFFNIFLKFLI